MKDLNAKFSNENTFPILLLCCSPFLLKIQKIWRQINFLIVIFPSEKRVLKNKNYLGEVIPRNSSFRWIWRHFILLVKKSDFMDRCAFEEGWLGNSEYDVVHNPRSLAQLLKVKIVLMKFWKYESEHNCNIWIVVMKSCEREREFI